MSLIPKEALRQQIQRERLVAEIAQRIRQSLNLEEILSTTVSEVRQFLQVDRVFIYRFEPNWSGVVVVESLGSDDWKPILGSRLKDPSFGEICAQPYKQGRIQATTDIYAAGLTQCYIDFLAQFQVRATLVVPILQGEDLWGLLEANHCSEPRQWQQLEIDLLKQLATQVAIAIQQSTLFEQTQTELNKRKRAEQALRESEELFRATFNQAAIGIAHVGIAGQWLMVNQKLCDIVGYSREELLERSFQDITHPDDLDTDLEYVRQMLAGEIQTYAMEKRYIRKDNSHVWIHLTVSLVREPSGDPKYFISIIKDITDRKRTEEIRRALEKEKELSELKLRFFSMASHEFRTPLSTILVSAQVLEHCGQCPKEKRLRNVQRIEAAAKHLTHLLDDILTINRAESGKLEFNPKLFDLEKFCRKLVEEIQLSASNQYTITFVSQGACKNGYVDEKLLRSIFTNLLSNAIKYSPQGGNVHFTLVCEQEEAIFRIHDEGIGIPSEDLKHLFEPFHRGKNVGTIAGTGLGLTVVKKCVDIHDGEIKVTSEVGVGTTFTVTLPLNLIVTHKS